MKTVKYILFILICFYANFNFSQCGPLTPSFTVNLVGQPSGTWTSPNVQRNDNCCGTIAPDKCLKFTILLDPLAMGINFQIVSGAVPPGALFYQINCGPPIAVGSPICLNGPGPHILTFCKPGNNNNSYAITSLPSPTAPDSAVVRSGCSVSLAVTGYSVPTINWTSVFPGPNGTYNSYLSCVAACASVVVTPTGTPPPYVDYMVSGFAPPPCFNVLYQDTVRVYFYNDLLAAINPTMATICFGQTNALLTATASGGLPPYSYTWSTGSNNQTVSVGPGTYTVNVNDNTIGCPPTSATAIVNSFSLPISANAGPNQTLCKTSPNAVLNGTVVMASGGMWSGGTGTYSPSQNSLNITYIPTPAELATGSVQLTFTTTGNSGCAPGTDTVILIYQNPPVANAGPDATVCANNSQVSLAGSITGFSSTPIWSTSGNGIFTSTANLTTTYTPGPADIVAGFVNLTLTTANNGVCPATSNSMQVIITPAPIVMAGPNQTICSSSAAVLSGTVSGPTITGFWSSTGSGSFSPSPNILNPNYFPSPSDITTGSVTLILTSTGNGNCIAVTNSLVITITKIATVTANSSQTVCSTTNSINIIGNIIGGTNTGTWSTTGSGIFNPGPNALNNNYFISPADIIAGTLTFSLTSTNNGLCPAVTNTLSLSIIQLATLTTGPSQTVCSNAGTINLTGNITGGTNTGNWTTTGNGIFNPGPTILNNTYSFTPADIIAGTIVFSLTSTNNGPCPAVTNTLNLALIQLATLTTGPSQTVCSNAGTINLTGNITGGTNTGNWNTNGSGSFNPGPTAINNTYFFTPGDIIAGTIAFSLTSTNNGPCPAITNTLSLTITQLATLTTGPSQTVCSNAGTINLTGNITGGTNTGNWTTTGNGIFNPGPTVLNNTYSFTPSDISAGTLTFSLTSTNNGLCPAVINTLNLALIQLATLTTGPSQTVCSNAGTINLTGNITGGTNTGNWNTNGSGSFNPGPTALNNTYFFTPGDIIAGTIAFSLTSTNNGPCPAITNTLSLTITQLATLTTGPSQTVCSNAGTISLTGNITGGTNTGNWTTSGNGIFNPGPTVLNNTYSFTPADIIAGTLTFSLTSTNNGLCPAVTNTLNLALIQLATLTTGPSQTVCSNAGTINLTGNITGGTNTGNWTTSGNGIFNPGPTVLNNTYSFTPSDIIAGTIAFSLTSTNNGPCPAVTNTLNLTLIQLATLTTGPSQTVCSNTGTINLTGNITGGTNTGNWTTSGNGIFNPGPTVLNNTYSFTPSDIIAGTIAFSLTSTNNGPCPAVTNTLNLTLIQLATLTTGPSQTVCSNTGTINLTGNITGGTNTGNWTTSGNGIFNPGPTVLNNTYSFTPADIIAGTIAFSLTSTNNGPCPAVTNTLNLTLIQLATLTTGPSQTVCSNAGTINLTGNITGGTNTGNWTTSGNGIFNPGPTVLNNTYSFTPADIVAGTIAFSLTSTNNGPCPAVTNTLNLALIQLATLTTGPSQTVCSNTGTINLTGNITGGTNTGNWTTSGNGIFNPGPTVLNNTYSFTPSDIIAGTIAFSLTSTNNGPCPAVTNTLNLALIQLATLTTGPSQTVCSNAGTLNLTGNITGGTNTGNWTTSGNGIFNPGPTVLNNTYSFTPTDVLAGTIVFSLTSTNNGLCPAVTNTLNLTLIQLATLTTGPSQTVCSNAGTISLTGNITGGTNTGNWNTNGSGIFNPGPGFLNNTYSITPGDIIAGTIAFSLISTNNGPCPAVTNTLNLALIQIATLTTGPSQIVCSNAGTINLTGNITGGTNTGNWTTSGNGIFTPGPTVLNNTYSFTPSDISAGTLTFSLTSTNNGLCPAVTNTLNLTLIQLATLTTGPSQTVCSNAATINLTGNITGGTNTGNWTTTGTGTFFPGPGFLNYAYSINPADIIAGTITFSLTSTNNGPCPAVTNTLNLTIPQLATVNAGPNQALCSTAGTIALSGLINPNTGIWTSNGAGTFIPNNTVLNSTYSISPADILAGSVTFTLSSTNNGPCPIVKDTVKIAIKILAVVNTGGNQSICSTTPTINLTGNVSGVSSSGIWNTNGSGSFNPAATFLNNVYSVSPSDISMGAIIFTLSSLNNGPCPVVTNTMTLTIFQIAIVNAGPNQALCSNAGLLPLTGSINSSSNTGIWSYSGTGTLNPNNTNLNSLYSFSQSDINVGSVTFTLSSTNNGLCPVVKDTVKISIKKLAVVNAGPDKIVCTTNTVATISGSVTMGSTSGVWSHTGSGNISPSNTALNISYAVSPQDINSGVVYLFLTSLNNGVCPAVIDTAKITIIENPSIKLSSDTTICSYQNPLKIDANLNGDYGQPIWSTNGSGFFIPNKFTNPVTYDFTGDIPVGVVTLSVSATYNGPCTNVKGAIRVVIRRSPTANFTASTYTANIPNDPVKFSNQSTFANTYQWDFGDGINSNLANPVHNFSKVGHYNVNLIAISEYGCIDTINEKILVISDIQFPNVFTPNTSGSNGGIYDINDYSNDVFFPYTSGVTEYNLQIFNRWGELIFESTDVKVGWDGYFKNKLCQQDGYVWKADVKFFDGRKYNKTGSVTLLR